MFCRLSDRFGVFDPGLFIKLHLEFHTGSVIVGKIDRLILDSVLGSELVCPLLQCSGISIAGTSLAGTDIMSLSPYSAKRVW